MEIQKYLI